VKAIVDAEPLRPSEVVATSGTPAEFERASCRSTTPEKLQRRLRGDLDTIIGKTLKKDPLERYPSVTALADDLRRYLRNEPIGARPDTVVYRAGKFLRRNRAAVALATLAALATSAGALEALVQGRTARAERDFAIAQLSRAEAMNDLNEFILSDAAPSGKPFTVSDLLRRAEHVVERQQDKHNLQRVEMLISLGRQYNVLEEQAKSRQLLSEAYDLSRSLSDSSIRARASCALASAIALAGEHDRAEQLVQDGLRELGDGPQFTLNRIFCLLRSTEVARDRGDAKEGVARMQVAQRVFRQAPLRSSLMEWEMLMEAAESYRYAGRYDDANSAFAQASAKLTALGRDDTQAAVTLFNNWGNTLQLAGRTLDSERAFRRAIEISRSGNNEDGVSPMILVNYARTLRELHETDSAADYAERGYAKAVQSGAQVVVLQSLILRAQIFTDRGDLERATRALDEVEPQLRRGLPAGHIAFGALASSRALVAQARGNLTEALRFSDQAVAIADAALKSGYSGGDYLPVFLTRRSALELQLGRSDLAEADASRSLTLLRASFSPEIYSTTRGRAYLALGRALAAGNRPREAHSAFASAAANLERAAGVTNPETRSARQLAGF
jgi:tetratricopeptide (TPR) repeat protein